MVHKNSAGFTLIEITLAMTISSGLAVIALMGFSSLRGQAEFTNAIDGLKEQITLVRTEALTTVNTAAAAGSDPGHVVLGRILTFTPGSSDIVVKLIVANNTTSPTVTGLVTDRTITVPWIVTFAGARIKQVAFIRSALDGSNITAVSPDGGWGGALPTYTNVSTLGGYTQLTFKDPKNRKATLDINPAANSIGRTYQ